MTQDEILHDLLRPLSPEEQAEYLKELDEIDFAKLLPSEPTPSGFPIMPHDPIWNPKPGPFYR